MSDLEKAARLALDALNRLDGEAARDVLRAALDQQAEPVADPFNCPKCGRHDFGLHGACPACDAQQAEPVVEPDDASGNPSW